jgi:HAD superfamily hydrolase (TIGR01456 family)
VENRLQMKLDKPFPIKSIFQLTDVIRWEINMQLFSDLLISNNGIPGTVRENNEAQKVSFHVACDDLLFKDDFPIPRLAAGSFSDALEHLFAHQYQRKIEKHIYGKPSQRMFHFARDRIREQLGSTLITNFYMIGDNPVVDIQGANNSGFISFLVKTGVFQGKDNCPNYPAKYCVDDVSKAIEMILNFEGIRI